MVYLADISDKVLKLTETWPVMVTVELVFTGLLVWFLESHKKKDKQEERERHGEQIKAIQESHSEQIRHLQEAQAKTLEAVTQMHRDTSVTYQKMFSGVQETIKDLFQATADIQNK